MPEVEKAEHDEIKELEKEGWKLCVGCINYFGESIDCEFCPIETRKIMGLPPEDSNSATVAG